MSDDYDDEGEPGGLWDPDAFTPPPAPGRPTLRIVTAHETTDQRDRRVDPTSRSKENDDHALVRLEQFRTASDGHVPRRSLADRRVLQRAAAAGGILTAAVAATAVGYTLVSAGERPTPQAPTQRLGVLVGADSERAAATRKVASISSAVRNERQPTSHARHHAKSPRRAASGSQKYPATPAQHAPTVTASHAPTTGATIVSPAAPTARPQTSTATATSEFGFEG
jgi:hypothetical protein